MDSANDVTGLAVTGFPIQKSPDQSLFSSSPRLIAAFHVFHRLLTPRHPPFALNSLATKYLTQFADRFLGNLQFFLYPNCQRTNLYKGRFHQELKSKCPVSSKTLRV
jgi:hypothetical protein